MSGALMIIFPSGEIFHVPPDMLNGSPFHNFLVPGIILILVNGVGQLVSGILTFRRHRFAGYVGATFGLGLIIWMFVQADMIGGGHILQYGYFTLGVVETAFSILVEHNLSRANGLHNTLQRK